jgi:ribulose-5-phosphate 4-epimerase/fuculose-1-phosphate aldolase
MTTSSERISPFHPDVDEPHINPLTGTAEMVALACRVLAHQGLAEDILGHVSVRTTNDNFMVRSRGPREHGLLFTQPADVHELSFGGPDNLPGAYNVPNELPIHREVLLARPDVNAVVHVHPPAVVAADLAGLGLRPIVGAYNIPAMRMADQGIPVYPRAVLINTTEFASDLVKVLGDAPACILRGHGIVTTGESVEQAVVRALNIDSLAQMTLAASKGGTPPPELSAQDISVLPDLGSHFNDSQVWRHHVARLQHAGLGL